MPRSALLRVAEDRTRALCAAPQPGQDGRRRRRWRRRIPRDDARKPGSTTAALAAAADAVPPRSARPCARARAAALDGLCFFARTHAREGSGARAGARRRRHRREPLEADAGAIPATRTRPPISRPARGVRRARSTATTAVAVLAEHEGARDGNRGGVDGTDAGVVPSAECLQSAEPPAYDFSGTALPVFASGFSRRRRRRSATPALTFPGGPGRTRARTRTTTQLRAGPRAALARNRSRCSPTARLCVEAGTRAARDAFGGAAAAAASRRRVRHRLVPARAERLRGAQARRAARGGASRPGHRDEGDKYKKRDNTMIAVGARRREAADLAHAAWRSTRGHAASGAAPPPNRRRRRRRLARPKKRKSRSMTAEDGNESSRQHACRAEMARIDRPGAIGRRARDGARRRARRGIEPGVASRRRRASRRCAWRRRRAAARGAASRAADAASGEWASRARARRARRARARLGGAGRLARRRRRRRRRGRRLRRRRRSASRARSGGYCGASGARRRDGSKKSAD